MPKGSSEAITLSSDERDLMHALYRQGGRERQMAPQIVYPEASCPHDDCDQPMQAIDFRPEDHGRAIHDPLVRAWWNDMGFVGALPALRRLDPLHHPGKDRHHAGGSGRVSSIAGRLARQGEDPLSGTP